MKGEFEFEVFSASSLEAIKRIIVSKRFRAGGGRFSSDWKRDFNSYAVHQAGEYAETLKPSRLPGKRGGQSGECVRSLNQGTFQFDLLRKQVAPLTVLGRAHLFAPLLCRAVLEGHVRSHFAFGFCEP